MMLVTYTDQGVIKGCKSGPLAVLQEYEQDTELNCLWSDTKVTSYTHYVASGEIVEKGDRPSPDHVWSGTSWQFDLSVGKQNKWSIIKEHRNDQEFGSFESLGHTFQCDEVSQRRIQVAVQLSILDTSTLLTWTLADNSVQTFNATEIQQIGQALGSHVNACHIKAQELRQQINLAETQSDLDDINW
jgi:hypothetical protein